jgi:hypothetical protein
MFFYMLEVNRFLYIPHRLTAWKITLPFMKPRSSGPPIDPPEWISGQNGINQFNKMTTLAAHSPESSTTSRSATHLHHSIQVRRLKREPAFPENCPIKPAA